MKEQEELTLRLRELEEERLRREEEQKEMNDRLESMMAQIEEERAHKAALQRAYEEEKDLMQRMAEVSNAPPLSGKSVTSGEHAFSKHRRWP